MSWIKYHFSISWMSICDCYNLKVQLSFHRNSCLPCVGMESISPYNQMNLSYCRIHNENWSRIDPFEKQTPIIQFISNKQTTAVCRSFIWYSINIIIYTSLGVGNRMWACEIDERTCMFHTIYETFRNSFNSFRLSNYIPLILWYDKNIMINDDNQYIFHISYC